MQRVCCCFKKKDNSKEEQPPKTKKIEKIAYNSDVIPGLEEGAPYPNNVTNFGSILKVQEIQERVFDLPRSTETSPKSSFTLRNSYESSPKQNEETSFPFPVTSPQNQEDSQEKSKVTGLGSKGD